ncbi:MAG: DUF4331 domain-containing protein [Acidobacteria bacterium]|nr:DUF4331 domain-containing protein [Acidobacteriota bacterium]
MKKTKAMVAALLVALLVIPQAPYASNHREAPITALDHKADITDVYAFVSYSANQAPNTPPSKVTLIMAVDPLLEPGNGPTLFPFDPGILYEIKVDNDHDAVADKIFRFRFKTEFQLPNVFTAVAGFENGAFKPGTSMVVVPPRIDDFDDLGLNLRQTYTVEVVDVKSDTVTPLTNGDGSPFFAVPGNAGPRTMDYEALFTKGTYNLSNGVSVFAGTTDDAFWIDLGGTFDTANLRTLGSGVPGVLTASEDAANYNFVSDTVSGYAVNTIAIELPIEMLTATGQIEPATSRWATIGMWATTSRQQVTIRRSPLPEKGDGRWRQVQRMGNSLINELIIGIGSKDRFSMDEPKNDAQFADFFLNPPIVGIIEALFGGALKVPAAPRVDLLPLVTYNPVISQTAIPSGPIADLLRLNTGVPATPPAQASRLGLIGGDPAGNPNGRRIFDDVTDITLRVGVGGVLVPGFVSQANRTLGINDRLGDGVNVDDQPYHASFPYVGSAPDGRNRRHIDPNEIGCGPTRTDICVKN